MPLYEYSCGDCQQNFEVLVRGEERPACPSCGGQRLEKQFSVPAAHTRSGPVLNSLPMGGGCGRPACGTGGCQGLEG